MDSHIVRSTQRWAGLALATGLLLQSVLGGNLARAEGFVDAAFETQWRTTDANRSGRTNQTYFWGPEAFAHTVEVYAEGGTDGQRRVQYFDKARMELTNRTGQPNGVTNGLLTVELVSGQMQVGDSRFIQREPASVVVAGDPLGNDAAPTYATFFNGRLAYGVEGAQAAPQRAGQPVREAIDRSGVIHSIVPPATVTYGRFFPQTGHNVADVFDTFFRQAPLSEATWLDVMGYPISEPFWAKNKVVVGGKQRDVLVQLFQRRALTYTPANPAAYQIEMGNIGQHYYTWRYGTDGRDRVPGNFRLINAIGTSLYSTSIRTPADRVRLGNAPAAIDWVWALNESRAVITAGGQAYLVDLRSPRPFVALPGQNGDVQGVVASSDGRFIAVQSSVPLGRVRVYTLGTLPGDNIAVRDSFMVEHPEADVSRFDVQGRFLALGVTNNYNNSRRLQGSVMFVDLATRATRTVTTDDKAPITRMEWLGNSDRLLVSSGGSDEVAGVSPKVSGSVLEMTASSGMKRTLLAEPFIRAASPSPDGTQFAVLSIKGARYVPNQPSSLITGIVRVRSITDPTRDMAPAYEQGTSGRQSVEPWLGDWSSDGSYVSVYSLAENTAGSATQDVAMLNSVTGKALTRTTLPGTYNSLSFAELAAPFTLLERASTYNGPDAQVDQMIKVRNVDGSDDFTLFSAQATPNTGTTDLPVASAQIVQVIVPE